MLMPSIGWHAYYGLLGALGVWLLIAPWLVRVPALAFAVVLALAVLRPLRADTPSWDWSSKAYFQRAGFFIEALRSDLLKRHPTVPPHSRLYFSQVPQNIGLVVADGPAFRVWYDDPTLRAGFYSAYAPRLASAPPGRDFFFKFDTTLTWREVVEGPEEIGPARSADPDWEEDHRELALVLGSAGDWDHAAGEMIKLQQAFPDRVAYAVNLAFVYARLQDTTQALAWYRRAAAMPNASASVREAAAEFENRLQPRR
jgi:tetratricopeptide (TPR) repeat protein